MMSAETQRRDRVTTVVASLKAGDKVVVTYTDGLEEIGTVRQSGLSILAGPTDPDWRVLRFTAFPYRTVRNPRGLPGPGVATVELWDETAWADLCADLALDYAQKVFDAEHCPKSEQGWRAKDALEAKEAFLAECRRGAS